MVVHLKASHTRPTQMRGRRGRSWQLIGPSSGSAQLDIHINELVPNSGAGPYHYHSTSENVYYILEGKANIHVEAGDILAEPGDVVFFAPGELHSVTNIGDRNLKLIETYSPAPADFIPAPDGE